MTTAQDGGKVVSLKHRPLFTPRKYSRYSFSESTPKEGWKIPMAPSGIETATFRFVAQHLNYCATAVPIICLSVLYLLTSVLWEMVWIIKREFERDMMKPFFLLICCILSFVVYVICMSCCCSRQVCKQFNLCTGRPPTECEDTRCCIIQFWPPVDEHNGARDM